MVRMLMTHTAKSILKGGRLFLLLAPFAVAGCSSGLLDKERMVLPPDIIKVTVPTETIPPSIKAVEPSPAAARPAQQAPPVDSDLLPKQLNPDSPDQLMPIPAPVVPPPNSGVPAPPHSASPGAARVAVTGPTDFSYRDLVLTEDTTWKGTVLINGALTVAPQATLTVQPGTVVRFQREGEGGAGQGALLVQGRLVVNGTAESPVRFTGGYTEARAGDWQSILFLASEKKNIIEHCIIEGAESGIDAAFSSLTLNKTVFTRCRTGGRFQDSVVVMTEGGASDCGIGCRLDDSEADVRHVDFTGNVRGLVAARSSLYLDNSVFHGNRLEGMAVFGGKLKIVGSSFGKNGRGLYLVSCEGALANCRITANDEIGVYLSRARLKISGNDISQNVSYGLRVEDGMGVAWGNSFAANGRFDIFSAAPDDFRAIANWWGGVDLSAVQNRVFAAAQGTGKGRILLNPVLRSRPGGAFLNSIAK